MTLITFYFVRHGESSGNKEGLFRGRTDFPLTELGIRQAESLKRAISGVKFDRIVSSPLKRALHTAEIIASGNDVEIMEEFNNMYLAEWEGKKKELIRKTYPKEWYLWIKEPEKLNIKNAETLDGVQTRAMGGIYKLIERYKGSVTLCVVTHRAVLKPLIAGLLGIKKPYFWRLHFDTASYTIMEFEHERGFTLVKSNVTHHLPEFEVERY